MHSIFTLKLIFIVIISQQVSHKEAKASNLNASIDNQAQNDNKINSFTHRDYSALGPDNESKLVKIYVQDNCKLNSWRKVRRSDLYGCVENLSATEYKRILVTGGAGFVGSHLVDSLMLKGHRVTVLDNFYTGRLANIEHWINHRNFELIQADVITPINIEVDQIYHLASPASPAHYMADPIMTIKTNTLGTLNVLTLAKETAARVVLASTSEVYGDPEVHPQDETYWGHVNPIGPRSCYDESKRLAESLCIAHNTQEKVSIGIARIFNTYGPRMHPEDGRVVSNFITQALGNQPITVFGTGEQTRSFQYITDLVEGLERLMESEVMTPVNLGNPNELTVNALAREIDRLLPESTSGIVFKQLPIDDPQRRRPDIRRAKLLLGWAPSVPLSYGLQATINHFKLQTTF